MLGQDEYDEDCLGSSHRHCSWMNVQGIRPRDGNWFLYVTCFYWSLTTLSTVGYGDITPNTTSEKLFTILVIITGVSGYATLIQAMGQMLAPRPSNNKGFLKSSAIRHYLYEENVPPDLSKRILHYLRRRDRQLHGQLDENVAAAVAALSKPLRRRLTLHTNRADIEGLPWFTGRPLKFVADSVPLLEIAVASPLENVGAKGSRADALVFVQTGRVVAFSPKREEEKTKRGGRRQTISIALTHDFNEAIAATKAAYESADALKKRTYGPGDHFGAAGCLLDVRWALDLVALADCEFVKFDREALLGLVAEHDHRRLAADLEREAGEIVSKHPYLFKQKDVASLDTDNDAAWATLASRKDDVASLLRAHLPKAALRGDDPAAAALRAFLGDDAPPPAPAAEEGVLKKTLKALVGRGEAPASPGT